MVKVSGGGEVRPDATTLTDAVPAVAMRLAGTVVLTCPELTKVVARGDPFHVIETALVKPEPLAVNVKSGPPEIALFGERLVRTSGALIVKVSAGGEVLPDSATVTEAVPAVAMRLAAMVVVS